MNISYQVLNKSRLPEVYSLAHKANLKAKHLVRPKPDGLLINRRDLDESDNTLVLGAISGGEIVATVSITADGAEGLDTDYYFPEKLQELRSTIPGLSSTWRIATLSSDRKVILSLVRFNCEVGMNAGMKYTVFVVEKHHYGFYQKVLGAELLEERVVYHFDNQVTAGLLGFRLEKGIERLDKFLTRGRAHIRSDAA